MFDVAGFQKKRGGRFGQPLHYFEQLESTNTTADLLARQGCPEGTLVLANEQIAGKGRKGNAWFSPADLNLYLSLVLRPADSGSLRFLAFMISLALQRSLNVIGIHSELKWPNDVLVSGRKIAGILIQTAMEEGRLQFAVVGCGVNVNVRSFPEEISETATSVAIEASREVSREDLLVSLLLEFERLYEKIDSAEWDEFASTVEQSSTFFRGCPVRILQEHDSFEGTTAGLDSFGGLRVQTSSGERIVYAGEVISCRKK